MMTLDLFIPSWLSQISHLLNHNSMCMSLNFPIFLWMEWVGGVKPIQNIFGLLEFFYIYKAPKQNPLFVHQRYFCLPLKKKSSPFFTEYSIGFLQRKFYRIQKIFGRIFIEY